MDRSVRLIGGVLIMALVLYLCEQKDNVVMYDLLL